MFQNYIATALNNLLKNKLFSLINITGLAIGLAACLLIALYVQYETSYDKQWDHAERLYRVNFAADMPGTGLTKFPFTSIMALPALKRYYPQEIELTSRVLTYNRTVEIGGETFQAVLARVDRDFNDMFSFDVVAGSLERTLSDPANIALSEDTAERLLGEQSALGAVLTIGGAEGSRDYQVTAIYRIPGHSLLDMPMLSLLDDTTLPASVFSWVSLSVDSYLRLAPGADIESMRMQLDSFVDANVDVSAFFPDPDLVVSDVVQLAFQNIQDMYLDPAWDSSQASGSRAGVYAFSAIAVLVLLTGCINFIVLATARATARAREVALRKVVGASRRQLVLQFLGEAMLIALLALVSALALVELLLPVFETMVGRSLAVDWLAPYTWMSLLLLLLIVGGLGGLYPALVLSRFYPAAVLKAGRTAERAASFSLRNMLVVFQFTVSIALMIATAVIYAQIEYSSTRDPGYNKDNLFVINRIDSRRYLYDRIALLKQEILKLPDVTAAAISTWQPSEKVQGFGSYDLLGPNEANFSMARTGIDADFFSTYQIPVIAGRAFSEIQDQPDPIFTLDPDITGAEASAPRNAILNLSAVREMGLGSAEAALGRRFRSVASEDGTRDYTVVGVVADTHFYSINALPRAEIFHYTPYRPNIVTVRYRGSVQAISAQLEDVWKSVMADEQLSIVSVDQLLAEEFAQEKTEARMLVGFSLLAITIACLGLYGTAAFTVAHRTREIGIRKVMGADIRQIVSLLMWQFSKPVLLANVIAWPLAMWSMLTWLQRFPYRIDAVLLVPFCVLAATIALFIAWATVAGNTMRVASTNPVHALRYA